jgi:hypothetical protein
MNTSQIDQLQNSATPILTLIRESSAQGVFTPKFGKQALV